MPPPEERFVDTGELRLHCLEWPSEGPPAVLLHATGFLARLWQPVAEALSDRYHVYAYDARGHGDSDKPESGYGWPAIAADLKGLLDQLDLRAVLAIGHSSGGAGIAHLAAKQPEYVAAAILIEPTVFPPASIGGGEERRETLSEGAAKRRMVWPSREELFHTYHGRSAFARWREDVLRLYVEHGTFDRDDGQVELKCPAEIEAELYRRSLSTETWGLLPDIGCPTLVLRGGDTEPMLARVAEGVAQRIPGARLVTVPGAGHFLPMERPEAVLEEIASFADAVAGAK